MARIPWDPDVNITKRRPAGMTSKVDPDDTTKPFVPFRANKGNIVKSKQRRVVPKLKTRLGVHGNDKGQSVVLMKHWKYRNFRKCGSCGTFDTYESRNPGWTRGVVTRENADKQKYEVEIEIKYWCYKCGATNDEVTKKYVEVEQFAPKARITCCAECGDPISFSRGDLAFPTGERDPVTNRPDFNCKKCNEALSAKKGGEKQ